MARVVLDGFDVAGEVSGVSRALRQLLPLVAARPGDIECVIVTTEEGRRLFRDAGGGLRSQVVVARPMPKSAWEQVGLPWYAWRLGARVVYTFTECGPLWGPKVLLHCPEDPYRRWQVAPADSRRERARRLYERAAMRPGLYRASVVVALSHAGAQDLARRFGRGFVGGGVVPLAVDESIFHPDGTEPREDFVFHLSAGRRDRTDLVLGAYALALRAAPRLPDLVVGGALGRDTHRFSDIVHQLGIGGRVRFSGYVSDDELRRSFAIMSSLGVSTA